MAINSHDDIGKYFLSDFRMWITIQGFIKALLFTARKCIFDTLSSLFLSDSTFSWNFGVLWGVSKKSWLGRCMQLSFMRFCKYLNQRNSKKNKRIEWKIFQGFFKKIK